MKHTYTDTDKTMRSQDTGKVPHPVFTIDTEIMQMMETDCIKEVAPYTFGHGKMVVFKKGLTFRGMQEKCPTWDAEAAVMGVNHMMDIAERGEQILFDLPAKEAKLLYFPADPDKRPEGKRPYVILCAGGGYTGVCSLVESIPAAAVLNGLGIDAFCLNYTSQKIGLMPRPLQDLADAVKLIEEKADRWNLIPDQYAVCGFSAGAHLAGMWAVPETGYKKYGLPKPQMVWLDYPMVSADLEEQAGKVMAKIVKVTMFGFFAGRKKQEEWALDRQITDDYPPVYLVMAKDDDTIPQRLYQDLITALETHGVERKIRYVESGSHGFGIGRGTPAEGWVEEAAGLWMSLNL